MLFQIKTSMVGGGLSLTRTEQEAIFPPYQKIKIIGLIKDNLAI